MLSKLIPCLVAIQLSASIYAASAHNTALLGRKSQDFKVWEQAFKGARECEIASVVAAAKYLEARYTAESDSDHRTQLHYTASSIYLNCPLECADASARHEMMLALQRTQIDIEKTEQRRILRKFEEENSIGYEKPENGVL